MTLIERLEALSGPEELEVALEREELILASLQRAFVKGDINRVVYENGFDATVARCSALSFAISALRARSADNG